MGANEKARPDDKQRSFCSRHGASVLHARRPPRGVRMTRVPEADVKDAYRKRREWYSRLLYFDDAGHLHLAWRVVRDAVQ